MPTTRRSTGAARGRTGPTKGQSTISFTNKVTKSVPKDVKSLITPATTTKIEVPERTKPVERSVEEEVIDKPEDDEQEQEQEQEQQGQQELEAEVPEKSEAEIRAEKLTDSQISKYWKGVEKERKAPRVHQEDLSINDKVLRYFDVSSQYGVSVLGCAAGPHRRELIILVQPCIGIDRTKRWQRAEQLGLEPPIEILSVLLKERKKTKEGVETAQMDQILNSIAIGP
ncbi:hypothetical protein QQS21_005902 [Conoideocrella luteorostrata]|uniref:DNA polymerase delta subunit 4 n=1 Tax=Conoideocrella luteorostrata TaxID=1105319 RepID=A0AAJ0CPN0_9HYPO|nr:hypothetical protein QQS21_005902 [Conoideocrella luteorostrata]